MRAILTSMVVLSLASTICHAMPSTNIDRMECSGTQTSSLSDVLSLSCSGDFSLIGGNIIADSKILISSIGALTLENLSITAPEVELIAGSFLSLGSSVSITTNSIYAGIGNGSILHYVSPSATISIGGEMNRPLDSGYILLPNSNNSVTFSGGGLITILPSVPEPDTYATMLAGLLILVCAVRLKKRRIA